MLAKKYCPAERRFDHHQRGFTEVFDDGFKTKLSSAGLIYKEYGNNVITEIVGPSMAQSSQTPEPQPTHGPIKQTQLDVEAIRAIWRKVYEDFIEEVDGIDNGIEQFEGTRNYKVKSTLSGRIGRINPGWNEPSSNIDRNARFVQALCICVDEFVSVVDSVARSWWPARAIVNEGLNNAVSVHSSRQIIVLEQSCPVDSHLFELEAEHGTTDPEIVGCAKYVLYPEGGNWRIKAIAEAEGSFTSRKKLPEGWRGLSSDKLSEASGIPGCVFVHAEGFVGGNLSKEGALAMAVKAIE